MNPLWNLLNEAALAPWIKSSEWIMIDVWWNGMKAERKNEIGANKLKQWSLMKREINKAKNEWYEIEAANSFNWITRKH